MSRALPVLLAGTLVALVGACGACDDESRPARQLPGAVYVIEGSSLVRIQGGTRTELGTNLYPSSHALPDGRIVAIASRGDGSADAEQLALLARDGRVQRLGPKAMQVRDPAVDPRGRWIVVAANLDGHSDLYRVELDGRATRLTNDVQGNYHPVVMGDGIVYVSSRDGDAELYRGSQRLTAFHRDDWHPTPSPRGDTLAFLSDREGVARVFLMAPDGTHLRRLTGRTDGAEESAPTWSPDGTKLVYVASGRVWLHDVATGTERALTADGRTELEPSFSPDGAWLAVARMRGDASDVWAVPIAAGEPVELARDARLPRWF